MASSGKKRLGSIESIATASGTNKQQEIDEKVDWLVRTKEGNER